MNKYEIHQECAYYIGNEEGERIFIENFKNIAEAEFWLLDKGLIAPLEFSTVVADAGCWDYGCDACDEEDFYHVDGRYYFVYNEYPRPTYTIVKVGGAV